MSEPGSDSSHSNKNTEKLRLFYQFTSLNYRSVPNSIALLKPSRSFDIYSLKFQLFPTLCIMRDTPDHTYWIFSTLASFCWLNTCVTLLPFSSFLCKATLALLPHSQKNDCIHWWFSWQLPREAMRLDRQRQAGLFLELPKRYCFSENLEEAWKHC